MMYFKRHPLIAIFILPPLLMMTLMITITLGVGFARAIGSNHSPNQITIEKTDSMYDDCVTFANARGFAPEVCEGIKLKESTQVADFNDGFSTAKQDDCQQGDTNACTWLKGTKP